MLSIVVWAVVAADSAYGNVADAIMINIEATLLIYLNSIIYNSYYNYIWQLPLISWRVIANLLSNNLTKRKEY